MTTMPLERVTFWEGGQKRLKGKSGNLPSRRSPGAGKSSNGRKNVFSTEATFMLARRPDLFRWAMSFCSLGVGALASLKK